MVQLRHEKLTYEIRNLIFEVRKKLKTGWSEEIYHQALTGLLQDKGIPVLSKSQKSVFHRNIQVCTFECDLIVWDLIILELKVLPLTTFTKEHQAQLISYLKCWEKDLGLLVNFGSTRAQLKRLVWDEPDLEIEETYDYIKPTMTNTDRQTLRPIRKCILEIGQQYGLGYPETMYRSIIDIELRHNGLLCQTDIEIPAQLDDRVLAKYRSDHLLVENKYLLNIRSLLDYPTQYDFARTKTYLNSLGLKLGLVINFGKKQLQIYGVNPD